MSLIGRVAPSYRSISESSAVLKKKNHGIYGTSCLRSQHALRPNITSNVDNNVSFVAAKVAVIINIGPKTHTTALSSTAPACFRRITCLVIDTLHERLVGC